MLRSKLEKYIDKGQFMGLGYEKTSSEYHSILLKKYYVLCKEGNKIEFMEFDKHSYLDYGSREFEISRLEKRGYRNLDYWLSDYFTDKSAVAIKK